MAERTLQWLKIFGGTASSPISLWKDVVLALIENWLRVELRHFMTLRTVVEEGSFGAAARRLGYTQSAVSHQITSLESRVGQRVLERRPGPGSTSQLTEAGAIVLSHGQEILRHLALAQANLAALVASPSQRLRVGFFQSVGSGFLPSVLSSLAEGNSAPTIELIQESESDTLFAMLSRGELDVALTDEPTSRSEIAFQPLFADPWIVLSRRGRLGSIARLGLAALDDEPFITFTHRCAAVRTLERSLESQQIRPHIVLRSDDPALIEELVLAGKGSALLPRIAVKNKQNPLLSMYEIDSVAERTVGVSSIAHQTTSSAVSKFAAAAAVAATGLRPHAMPI